MQPYRTERVQATRADITKLPADAIVTSASEWLLTRSGVDAAIHRVAGPELSDACRALGGCATGDAKMTEGYKLAARFVVHTVGPIWAGGREGEPELLSACYRRAIELAAARGLSSIAFSGISTGTGGYPADLAASIAVEAVRGALRRAPGVDRVVFCCTSAQELETYRELLGQLPPGGLDGAFQDAVSAMDAGDVPGLERRLRRNPSLVQTRLTSPGIWLRANVGAALDGFFKAPYLLWFVAEDPVRNDSLPPNIAAVASTIIDAAREQHAVSLQQQIDYALQLVAWSAVARRAGVQIPLIDVLIDAGASSTDRPDSALVSRNVVAAEHLLRRGARPTLGSALCLGRWDQVEDLTSASNNVQKQYAFMLAAVNGRANALHYLLGCGVAVDHPTDGLTSHGNPLHHAVCSGSLEAVMTLVLAGASLRNVDSRWATTPLALAESLARFSDEDRRKTYLDIASYLRTRAA